jgi:hypothetical protein
MKSTFVLFALALLLLVGLPGVLPAQVIQVAAGVGTLSTAYASAPAGAILELTDAGGQYIEQTDIFITKNVTIRAKAGLATKPVLFGIGATVLYQNIGRLTVQGIHFEGLISGNQSPAYFIETSAMDTSVFDPTTFGLFIDNCEFYNGAQRAIYVSDATKHPLDSLIVTNCVFVNNAKMPIYHKAARNQGTNPAPKIAGSLYLKMENCLIYKTTTTSDGWATYIEPACRDSATWPYPVVFINHLTVDSMALGGINTYTTPGTVIQNSIVVNNKDTTKYAYGAETGRFTGAAKSTIKNCLYYNARFVTYGSSAYAQYPDTSNITNALPLFNNIANLDFSLKAGSPGKNAATDGKDLGYIAGGLASAIEPMPNPIPDRFQLSQNYPNPFNPATTIEFSVPKGGQYSIKVFNMLGQEVATVFNQVVAPGTYSTRFDGAGLASGLYVYRFKGDNVTMTKAMMLVK